MKTTKLLTFPAAAAMILGVWSYQRDDVIRWRDASGIILMIVYFDKI